MTGAAAVEPITAADLGAVTGFLRDTLNPRLPWDRACATVPWSEPAPNRGFLLRDGERVVGALLALYSHRLVDGQVERFCNLGSWCVLPRYRSRSIALLRAALAQPGYHFTVLSPNPGSRQILPGFGFRALDTAAVLLPNLPWPAAGRRIRVSADPDVIETTLTGTDLELYRHHVGALAARHLVLVDGSENCHVIYRTVRYRGVPAAAGVLHVGNPALFGRALRPVTRHLLHRGLVATLLEQRLVGYRPRWAPRVRGWPKLYRSDTLDAAQIDYLYSELVCLPW